MKTIDVQHLQKGDYLSPIEIEEITGEMEGTREYQFALMQLRQEIEHGLRCLGRPATIKTEGSGLRVLTDAEAAVYNARHGDLARFKLFLRLPPQPGGRRGQPVGRRTAGPLSHAGGPRQVRPGPQADQPANHVEPVHRMTPGLKMAANQG